MKPSLVAACALALACDAASPPTALQSRSSAESSPLEDALGAAPDTELDAASNDAASNDAASNDAASNDAAVLAPAAEPGAAPVERPAAAADGAPSSETPPL